MKWLYDLTVCLIWPKPKVSRQATRVVVSSPEPPPRTVGAGDLVLALPRRKSTQLGSLGTGRRERQEGSLGTGRRERQEAAALTNSKPSFPPASTKFSVKCIDK